MDVAARAGTASIEARATRMGRRQRWGRIYLLKTPGELKSSVLAPSGRSMAAAALAVNRSCTRLGSKMDAEWRHGEPRRAKGKLPEEGLEPTRTYAQALLRRPRLPFRHSGADTRRRRAYAPASISEYARWELIRDVSV